MVRPCGGSTGNTCSADEQNIDALTGSDGEVTQKDIDDYNAKMALIAKAEADKKKKEEEAKKAASAGSSATGNWGSAGTGSTATTGSAAASGSTKSSSTTSKTAKSNSSTSTHTDSISSLDDVAALFTAPETQKPKADQFEREGNTYLEGEGGDGFVKKDASFSGLIGSTIDAAKTDLILENKANENGDDSTVTVGSLAELSKTHASSLPQNVTGEKLPRQFPVSSTGQALPVAILGGRATYDREGNIVFKGAVNSNDVLSMAAGNVPGFNSTPQAQKDLAMQRLNEDNPGNYEEQIRFVTDPQNTAYLPEFRNDANSDLMFVQTKLQESNLDEEEQREFLQDYKEARTTLTKEQRWNLLANTKNIEDLADAVSGGGASGSPSATLVRAENRMEDQKAKEASQNLRADTNKTRQGLADLLENEPAVAEYAATKEAVPFLQDEKEKAQASLDHVRSWVRYADRHPDGTDTETAKKAADTAVDEALKDTQAKKDFDAAEKAHSDVKAQTETKSAELAKLIRSNVDQNKKYLEKVAKDYREAKTDKDREDVLKKYDEDFLKHLKNGTRLKTSAETFKANLAAEGAPLATRVSKEAELQKARDTKRAEMAKSAGSNPVKDYEKIQSDNARPSVDLPEELRQKEGQSAQDWRANLEAKKNEIEEDIRQYNGLIGDANAKLLLTPPGVKAKYEDALRAIREADEKVAAAASAYVDGRVNDMEAALRAGGYKGDLKRASFDAKGKKDIDKGREAARKNTKETIDGVSEVVRAPNTWAQDVTAIPGHIKTGAQSVVDLNDILSGAASEEFKRITAAIDKGADAMFTKMVGTERRSALPDSFTKLRDMYKPKESKAISGAEALSKRVQGDNMLTLKGRAENRVASNNFANQRLDTKEKSSKSRLTDLDTIIKENRYNKNIQA